MKARKNEPSYLFKIFKKIMKNIFIFLIPYLFITSCSTTRRLSEDQLLYKGAKIKVESEELGSLEEFSLKKDLHDYIRPEPNKALLGFIPIQLWIYNSINDSAAKKGLGKWIREKLGEPPVVYENQFVELTKTQLQNRLYNTGYFLSDVEPITNIKNQKIKIKYKVRANEPYEINEVFYPEITGKLTAKLDSLKEYSLLVKGDDYNLDNLKNERQRLDNGLKNEGYYFFSPDYLMFQVDSTIENKKVNLYLVINETTPPRAKKKYYIKNIYVHTDYSLENHDFLNDTLDAGSYYFIYKNLNFDTNIIARSIVLEKGKLFEQVDYTATINKLLGLGVFKYVHINFDSQGETDSLNVDIYATPVIPNSIRMELQAVTKSNSFTGPGISVNYQNRNLFQGAENLLVDLHGSFETQVGQDTEGLNSYEAGIMNNLSFPKFVIPFQNKLQLGRRIIYTPKTSITLGFDFINQVQFFTLYSFNSSWGYFWKNRPDMEHELLPVFGNFTSLAKTTPRFQQIIDSNPFIARSFQEQFILGISYSFTYNEQQVAEPGKTDFYFKWNNELTGNTLSLFNRIFFQHNPNPEEPNKIFGAAYSQYAKTSFDFRYYYHISENSTFAQRIILGIGIPYGNSDQLPYFKQFFVGGSSSIRAFPYRSLGPGAFDPPTENGVFAFNQAGDLKFESSLEYRFGIVSFLNGALFLDAGNVWLLRQSKTPVQMEPMPQDGKGVFYFNSFLNQVALGTGFGLRVDISFIVLRFDLAFPLRKPHLEPGERWTFDNIDFTDATWRRNNLILNIAIGYPF